MMEIRIRIWIGGVSAQSFLLPQAEVHCASLSRQAVHLGCLCPGLGCGSCLLPALYCRLLCPWIWIWIWIGIWIRFPALFCRLPPFLWTKIWLDLCPLTTILICFCPAD